MSGDVRAPYAALSKIWDGYWQGFVGLEDVCLFAIRQSGLQPVAAVDLACGTGRSARKLATRFQRVHAIDSNPHMLAVARANPNERIIWREGSLVAFDVPESVQAVVCSGDSLNYLSSTAELEACFEKVAQCLVLGGVFLFDVLGVPVVPDYVVVINAEGHDYFVVHRYDPLTRTMPCFAVTPDGVEDHPRRPFDKHDVLAAAGAAGFELAGYAAGHRQVFCLRKRR